MNKKYYYYSIIGLTSTRESFMKIVCVETEHHFAKGSNDYIIAALNHVINRYNVSVTSIGVLYSADKPFANMPNVDNIKDGETK